MSRRRLLANLGLAVATLLTVVSQAQQYSNTLTQQEFTSVVQRLEQGQREGKPGVPYQVTRHYQLIDGGSSRVNSDVVVGVEYSPPNRESYVIHECKGSSRGEQVVRRILDHESAFVAAGPPTWSSALLTRDNYIFSNLGETTLDGEQFYLVGLTPKRKQKELISGQAWVDKQTFLIRRIEGELAKSPSWLLKKVHVQLDFSDVSGLWLQTGMQATADVRFLGTQTLQSQTLNSSKSVAVASRRSPRRVISRSTPAWLWVPPQR